MELQRSRIIKATPGAKVKELETLQFLISKHTAKSQQPNSMVWEQKQNTVENSEKNLHNYGQLIFDKGSKITLEKKQLH